jgi:hypothetical protein
MSGARLGVCGAFATTLCCRRFRGDYSPTDSVGMSRKSDPVTGTAVSRPRVQRRTITVLIG